MESHKIEEYELVLREIINNRYNPISPTKMRELFGMDHSSQPQNDYERMKRSLQRILDFYNSTKIVTYVTDTIQNEIKLLTEKKDMKKLKPYIELLKQKSSKTYQNRLEEMESKDNTSNETNELMLKNICDMYQRVKKVKTTDIVYKTKNGKKIDESLIPSNSYELEKDDKGYFVIDINGKETKVKPKDEEKTYYQLVGRKFDYIDINFFEETVEYEKHLFTNDTKKIIRETICLEDEVDLENTEISSYDIMYRLFLECDFKDEYGKLNSSIEFQIPQKNIDIFVEFFVSSISTFNYNIQSQSIVKLSKSDMYQNKSDEIKDFITNTFSKVMIKLSEYHKGDNSYPIQLLIDLVESKSKLNLKFNIDDEEVEFSKTSIKKVIVKENEIDIKLSHSTISLLNMNQISLIQTYDIPLNQSEKDEVEIHNKIMSDIRNLKNILIDMNSENTKDMVKSIEELENITDLFVF